MLLLYYVSRKIEISLQLMTVKMSVPNYLKGMYDKKGVRTIYYKEYILFYINYYQNKLILVAIMSVILNFSKHLTQYPSE